jgi:hypothetical protein
MHHNAIVLFLGLCLGLMHYLCCPLVCYVTRRLIVHTINLASNAVHMQPCLRWSKHNHHNRSREQFNSPGEDAAPDLP